VLDMNTEVEIYRNVFGRHIESNFLPRVLKNFARVIIASRMSTESETMMEWLGDPAKYERYCDPSFLLLRMQIYTGRIPLWLSEEDRKAFTAKVRRRLIAEGEREGHEGFSGRDSIKIFGDFYSRYSKDDGLIGMSTLVSYFTKARKDLAEQIPEGFVDCLLRMYDFNVLQETKESLYYYNEEQISRDVLDYLYAINFEIGTAVRCPYTGDRIEITDAYLDRFEHRVLGQDSGDERRLAFRKDVQKRYASRTLTQEILVESKQITESALYGDLHDRYVYRLKDRVLDPFLKNQNFRRAIKDYDTETFKTYDKRIREDVSFLIDNLVRKYGYTTQGARELCVYVIDNSLAERFAEP